MSPANNRPTSILAFSFALALFGSGCGGESGAETGDTENLTDAIAFTPLSATRIFGNGPPDTGLKVIRNTKEYVAAFWSSPPSSVDFNKSWVVSYSTQATHGGGSTEITKITKSSGKLHVSVKNVTPGEHCIVPEVVTYPQMTVMINKQPKTPSQSVSVTNQTDDCGGTACGSKTCTNGEVCCDATCGMCGVSDICPEIACAPTDGSCGETICAPDEICCSQSCGICLKSGEVCPAVQCPPPK